MIASIALALLLLFPAASAAQDEQQQPSAIQMPGATSKEQFFKQYDLTGGLNTKMSSYMIRDNEAAEIKNLTLDTTFSPGKRPGYDVYSTVSVALSNGIRNVYRFYRNDGNFYDIAQPIGSGAQPWYVAENTGSFSATATTFGAGASIMRCETFQNHLFVADDTDPVRMFDGSNATDETHFPVNGKYMLSSKNRLWIGGADTAPNTIYFSSVNSASEPADWTAVGGGGSATLPNDGDVITGLANVNTFMLVFRKNSIFIMNDPTVGSDGIAVPSVRLISQGIGCIAPRSIVKMEAGAVFFLGKRGVYSIDGNEIKYVSLKIEPEVGRVGDELGLTYKRQYWLVQFGSDTSELVYDVDLDAWTKYNEIPVSCGFTSEGNVDLGVLFLGMSNAGFIYRFGSAAFDDGVSFDCRYKTKNFDMGNSFLYKRFRNILVDMQTSLSTVEVRYSIDRDRITGAVELETSDSGPEWDTAEWDTDVWSGAVFTPMVSLPQRAVGRSIQFEFVSNALDEDFKVFGYGVRYATYPHRGETLR